MPSRKKAKGKARKAVKEAKAKEEESRAVVVAAGQRHEESIEAQLQRLRTNATSPKLRRHGCYRPSLSPCEMKICDDFINTFIASFRAEEDIVKAFITAHHATCDEYTDFYLKASKMDTVISMLLASGTQCILDGDNKPAQLYACLAGYFEEGIAVYVHKTKAVFDWTKAIELCCADDHTLVSYYRKRIPCSCLDKKYKEVKSLKKMGRCYNANCNHPDGLVERSRMFSCTQCGKANYCSVDCQKSHWKEHRVQCEAVVKQKAAFDSEQS